MRVGRILIVTITNEDRLLVLLLLLTERALGRRPNTAAAAATWTWTLTGTGTDLLAHTRSHARPPTQREWRFTNHGTHLSAELLARDVTYTRRRHHGSGREREGVGATQGRP